MGFNYVEHKVLGKPYELWIEYFKAIKMERFFSSCQPKSSQRKSISSRTFHHGQFHPTSISSKKNVNAKTFSPLDNPLRNFPKLWTTILLMRNQLIIFCYKMSVLIFPNKMTQFKWLSKQFQK